jgi:hypothetical protein
MQIFRIIGLVVFIIVLILFTVGYVFQPVVNISIGDTTNKELIMSNFNDFISGNIGNIYNVLFYMCLATSILLLIGIIIGFIGVVGFTFISKIIFLVVLILMIIEFIIIQITISGSDIITKLIDVYQNKNANGVSTTPKISNGTGYYLMVAATVIMFINVIIYGFLA